MHSAIVTDTQPDDLPAQPQPPYATGGTAGVYSGDAAGQLYGHAPYERGLPYGGAPGAASSDTGSVSDDSEQSGGGQGDRAEAHRPASHSDGSAEGVRTRTNSMYVQAWEWV